MTVRTKRQIQAVMNCDYSPPGSIHGLDGGYTQDSETIVKVDMPDSKASECWQEVVFRVIDGFLTRAVPGILIFAVFYLLAHTIYRAVCVKAGM